MTNEIRQQIEERIKAVSYGNNYNECGRSENPTEWVFSNSSLSTIDPDLGGHPKTLYNFFAGEKVEKETGYFITGSLLHEYMQDKTNFAVSEIEKPSDKLGLVAEACLAIITQLEAEEKVEEELTILLSAIRHVGWNPKWSDEAVIKNSKDIVLPYVKEVLKMEGKKILTKKTADTLSKCIDSIEANKNITKLAFNKDTETSFSFTEQALYGTYNLNLLDKFKVKGKLDRFTVDTVNKVITLIDYKTTSNPVTLFYRKSFNYLKYFRQMAFYKNLLADTFPNYKIECFIIVVETTGDFNTAIFKVSDYWLGAGDLEIKQLFSLIQLQLKYNDFTKTVAELLNNGYALFPEKYLGSSNSFIQLEFGSTLQLN